MSSITLYRLLDQNEKPIGRTFDQSVRMWFPTVRECQKQQFDFEVGQILTGLSKILTGKTNDINIVLEVSEGMAQPAPEKIAFIESDGGTVSRSEFGKCIETYITELRRIQDTAENTGEEIEEDPFDVSEFWIREEIKAAEAAIEIFSSAALCADHNQTARVQTRPPTPRM